jgi:hypothetical protein
MCLRLQMYVFHVWVCFWVAIGVFYVYWDVYLSPVGVEYDNFQSE